MTQVPGEPDERARHLDLAIARAITIGPVALAFPAATAAVYLLGTDRRVTADVLAVIYSVGLFAGITTSLWPLPSLRAWSRSRRIESASYVFMIISYTTHLTWELGWLLLHRRIETARDAAWAYPWWAYIDGGDTRYAEATAELVMMELLSVINGLVGATGLALLSRARPRVDPRGVLLCMATAVVHLYSVSLYYGGELIAGLPSVNTSSVFDTVIKFGLANAPWAVFPWFVLYWGQRTLRREHAVS